MAVNYARRIRTGLVLLVTILGLPQLSVSQVVTEYSDSWSSEELDGNNNATLYGYGSASTDGDGWLRLQVRIWNPNAQSVAYGGANGYNFVERTISTLVNWNSPRGDYETVATVDYNFEHYACATSFGNVGAGIKAYKLVQVNPNATAIYSRCNPQGWCDSAKIRLDQIQPPSVWFPSHAYISVLSIRFIFVRVCYSTAGQAATQCGPD